MSTTQRRLLVWRAGLGLVAFAATGVVSFTFDHRQPHALWAIAGQGAIACLCVIVAIYVAVDTRFPLVLVLLNFVTALALVVLVFTNIYWNNGDATNFSPPLTHLDSLYFSVGTLTTAGTGRVVAISQTARLFQTLQMIISFPVVVIAAALTLNRIGRDRTPASS